MSDLQERVYIFGFGSLINSDSRSKTADTGPAIPVTLHGIRRTWALDLDFRFTSLGISQGAESHCNGVIFEVPPQSIPALDARESNYQRIEVPTGHIQTWGSEVPDGQVFVYLSKRLVPPGQQYPIVQSYIDVVMAGCIEIDRQLGSENLQFTREFIQSTIGWSFPHYNDRHNPVYPRALDYGVDTGSVIRQIDQLLAELKPGQEVLPRHPPARPILMEP